MNTPTTQRFHHAIVSVDTDSEEDTEIDTSAVLTSGGMNIEHHAFPSPAKRLKTHHSKEQSTHDDVTAIMQAAAIVNSPHAKDNPGEEKRKNQVRVSKICSLDFVDFGRLESISSNGYVCKTF
jgi:hypothetical protein